MNLPFYEDLAVLFLTELVLAKSSHRSITDISMKHHISPLFLKKIARSLRNAGLIQSKEGLGGGYRLLKDPATTSLWDIYHAVDQKKSANLDSFTPNYLDCPINAACVPQIIGKIIRTTIKQSLESVSLKSLVMRIPV